MSFIKKLFFINPEIIKRSNTLLIVILFLNSSYLFSQFSISPTTNDVKCYGENSGSITLNISGVTNYSVQWTDGYTTDIRDSIYAGEYFVNIFDQTGSLLHTDSFTISQPDSIYYSFSVTNILCFGNSTGAIDLFVSGGTSPYDYLWDNNAISQDLNGMPAGTYTVTISDFNLCQTIDSTDILQPTEINIAFNGFPFACPGGTQDVIAASSGGVPPYTYLWFSGQTTQNLTGLSPGSYPITVTDGNSCNKTGAHIIIPATSNVSINANINPVKCKGDTNGSIQITASGGFPVGTNYHYNWSTGETSSFIDSLLSGVYYVTATDSAECKGYDTIIVPEPNFPISFSTSTDSLVICSGTNDGAISIQASGGWEYFYYNWSNGSTDSTISHLPVGQYFCTISDSLGCDTSLSISITESLAAIPVFDTSNYNGFAVSCSGFNDGILEINFQQINEPYSLQWINGESTNEITNLIAGNYTVTVSDSVNCKYIFDIDISEPEALNFKIDSIKNPDCFNYQDGLISISASGGISPYSFVWNTSSTENSLSGIGQGNYSFTIIDNNNCSFPSNEIQVIHPDSIEINSINKNPGCYGYNDGRIDLLISGGTSPYTFVWNNSENFEDLFDLSKGEYSVTLTDANNCQNTYSTILSEPDEIKVEAIVTNASCIGNYDALLEIFVSDGIEPYSFNWSGGSLQQNLEGIHAGKYSVTISDYNDCNIISEFTVGEEEMFCLAIPSVFTPNGDSHNDKWVISNTHLFPEISVKVFNRWGLEVFSSNGYPESWDGTFDGETLPSDSYFYVIKYSSESPEITGDVTIVR